VVDRPLGAVVDGGLQRLAGELVGVVVLPALGVLQRDRGRVVVVVTQKEANRIQ